MIRDFNELSARLMAYVDVHQAKMEADPSLHDLVHDTDYVKATYIAYARLAENPEENVFLHGDNAANAQDALVHSAMELLAKVWAELDEEIMDAAHFHELALSILLTGLIFGRALEEHNVIRLAKAGELFIDGYSEDAKTSS